MNFRQLPLTLRETVRPEHLDHMDHMNVMWYMHFFDRAIWGLYDLFDFGIDYHTKTGFGSFGLETHIRYLAELRSEDQLNVYTRMLARNEKLFHYIHFMERARDGELSATCELLGVHIDLSTRLSSRLPANVAAAMDRLIAEHNKLEWQAPVSGSIVIASE